MGDPDSAARLGAMYRDGRGVAQDAEQAQSWLAQVDVLKARELAERAARPPRHP